MRRLALKIYEHCRKIRECHFPDYLFSLQLKLRVHKIKLIQLNANYLEILMYIMLFSIIKHRELLYPKQIVDKSQICEYRLNEMTNE